MRLSLTYTNASPLSESFTSRNRLSSSDDCRTVPNHIPELPGVSWALSMASWGGGSFSLKRTPRLAVNTLLLGGTTSTSNVNVAVPLPPSALVAVTVTSLRPGSTCRHTSSQNDPLQSYGRSIG